MDNYRQKIANYYRSLEYRRVIDFFNQTTFFDILGKARDENAHSAFLGWLLNPEKHDLGTNPLKYFIQMLCEANHHLEADQKKLSAVFENLDINPDFEVKNIVVKLEQPIETSSNNGGRIDILIEFNLYMEKNPYKTVMVIENKVFSKEQQNRTTGKSQTEKYKEWVEKKYKDYQKILVYLTPNLSLPLMKKVECDCQDYIQINYQMIVDRVIEYLLEMDIDEKTRWRLQEYLVCLSKPSTIQTKNINKKIMAMANEQKQLLQDFWNKNRELILAAINSLELDDSDKQIIEKVASTVRNLYTISHKDNVIKRDVKMTRVAMEIIRHRCSEKEENYKSLREFFKDVKSYTKEIDGEKSIIIKQSDARKYTEKDKKTGELKSVKRFYDSDDLLITLSDGEKIVISNQWRENENFVVMKKIVEEWGYSITK